MKITSAPTEDHRPDVDATVAMRRTLPDETLPLTPRHLCGGGAQQDVATDQVK